MSKTYRISVKINETICTDNEHRYPLKMNEILPLEEMESLLIEVLIKEGFVPDPEDTQDPAKLWSKTGDAGETITVNLQTMEITARLENTRHVEQTVEENVRAPNEISKNTIRKNFIDQQKDDDFREMEETLRKSEPQRRLFLNRLIQQVYAEALKRKAARLGNVLGIQESISPTGEYQLTIQVEQ
ncbi:MAG: hypothetical protein HQM12_20395 [SAR324 cluster bacterium]|nr:hypothetical protein [SAR324 cluster bacterium]